MYEGSGTYPETFLVFLEERRAFVGGGGAAEELCAEGVSFGIRVGEGTGMSGACVRRGKILGNVLSVYHFRKQVSYRLFEGG